MTVMCVQVINEGTSTSGGAAFGAGVLIEPCSIKLLTELHDVTFCGLTEVNVISHLCC